MRNEMSQMQVGKMAAVRNLQEAAVLANDVDAVTPLLNAAKSGEETHLDVRETVTGSSQADVARNNSVCSTIGGDGGPSLPGEACTAAASDARTCVTSVAQCNHIGESNNVVTKLSQCPPVASNSSEAVSGVTNSIVAAGEIEPGCSAVSGTNVNITDSAVKSEQTAVPVASHSLEPSHSLSTTEGTSTLAAVKDVLSAQSTAPGSPHGVTVPAIRTNTVNMVMPAAVAPSAALRTLAPRIIVSTSPATTVLRVQTAAGKITAQPLPTVPSQQLILPVRNQGTAVARVLVRQLFQDSRAILSFLGHLIFHFHFVASLLALVNQH